MEKIYILLVHQVYDGSVIRLDATPYADYNEAKKAFDDIVSNETKIAETNGWEFDDNDDTYFCAFESGRFCENNTMAQLNEQEILKKSSEKLA